MGEKKAEILILGSFHMFEHEGLDTDQRQSEIEELVAKLERFQPTKIAVEMVPATSESCNVKYQQYLSKKDSLDMNEIYQIGFRLARKMGHKQIYPTDWMGEVEMSYGQVAEWAEKNQPELLKTIFEGFSVPELSEDKEIIDYYKELNDPDLLHHLHKIYINLARIGDIDHYIGMNWLSWWYKRNLIMFSNLSRLIESSDEKVLFIVGSSHSSIVTKFIEESEVYKVVSPLDYLV